METLEGVIALYLHCTISEQHHQSVIYKPREMAYEVENTVSQNEFLNYSKSLNIRGFDVEADFVKEAVKEFDFSVSHARNAEISDRIIQKVKKKIYPSTKPLFCLIDNLTGDSIYFQYIIFMNVIREAWLIDAFKSGRLNIKVFNDDTTQRKINEELTAI